MQIYLSLTYSIKNGGCNLPFKIPHCFFGITVSVRNKKCKAAEKAIYILAAYMI